MVAGLIGVKNMFLTSIPASWFSLQNEPRLVFFV